jgi:hypothetical protein
MIMILNDRFNDILCHSYNINIGSSYVFEWNDSGENIRFIINNSKCGYTGFYSLTNFLLEESFKFKNYETYSQFCKEIRNFQRHYYSTTSNSYGELYTSNTEVELLNPENRLNKFKAKKDSDTLNTAVKIEDIINYFELDVVVKDEKLLNKHIDTYYLYDLFGYYEPLGNITVPDVECIVIDTIEGKISEPFSIRKHSCDYESNYKLKVNNGFNQINFLVEWNFEMECYRIEKEDKNYLYFQSPNSLISYILATFDEEQVIDRDELISECICLIKSIERSSMEEVNLEYLINNKDPEFIDDLPF